MYVLWQDRQVEADSLCPFGLPLSPLLYTVCLSLAAAKPASWQKYLLNHKEQHFPAPIRQLLEDNIPSFFFLVMPLGLLEPMPPVVQGQSLSLNHQKSHIPSNLVRAKITHDPQLNRLCKLSIMRYQVSKTYAKLCFDC